MTARHTPARAPVNPDHVAGPRRNNVMHGPRLSGGDDAPAREGALDYAAIPSIINGRPVPFRVGPEGRHE